MLNTVIKSTPIHPLSLHPRKNSFLISSSPRATILCITIARNNYPGDILLYYHRLNCNNISIIVKVKLNYYIDDVNSIFSSKKRTIVYNLYIRRIHIFYDSKWVVKFILKQILRNRYCYFLSNQKVKERICIQSKTVSTLVWMRFLKIPFYCTPRELKKIGNTLCQSLYLLLF